MDRPHTLHARSSDDRATIDYDPQAGLVIVAYRGEVTQDSLVKAHEALVTLMAGGTITGVVIDSSAVEARYTPAELIEALEVCLNTTRPKRCAMVLGAGSHEDALMLVETVCFNHGTTARAFDGLDDARVWARDG